MNNLNYRIAALPFQMVYHNRDWAQLPCFKGYLAYVPCAGDPSSRAIKAARRRNLAEVLACVIEDLERKNDTNLRGELAMLRRIDPKKEPLPTTIRYDFVNETRHYRSLPDGSRQLVRTERSAPYHKTLAIEDLARSDAYCGGYEFALGKAMADVWDDAAKELEELEKESELIASDRSRDPWSFLDEE